MINHTLNLLSTPVYSTCFLVGPMRQLKNMFDKKRIIATIIVVISFVLTLIAAIVVSVFIGKGTTFVGRFLMAADKNPCR